MEAVSVAQHFYHVTLSHRMRQLWYEQLQIRHRTGSRSLDTQVTTVGHNHGQIGEAGPGRVLTTPEPVSDACRPDRYPCRHSVSEMRSIRSARLSVSGHLAR